MTDVHSRLKRSLNMSRIRSRGNRTTEHAFLRLLRSNGITGWRRHLPLPGKPDFAFRSNRLVIFVDGCFWHGCPRCYRLPEDNREYWLDKVERNRRRDRIVKRELALKGWKVLRVWEHSLKDTRQHSAVIRRVRTALGR